MTDDDAKCSATELEEVQHALGRAVEVLALHCAVLGHAGDAEQAELSKALVTMLKEKRYSDLADTLTVMAESFAEPPSATH